MSPNTRGDGLDDGVVGEGSEGIGCDTASNAR